MARLEHLARVARVIKSPGGNALLVGGPSSAEQKIRQQIDVLLDPPENRNTSRLVCVFLTRLWFNQLEFCDDVRSDPISIQIHFA